MSLSSELPTGCLSPCQGVVLRSEKVQRDSSIFGRKLCSGLVWNSHCSSFALFPYCHWPDLQPLSLSIHRAPGTTSPPVPCPQTSQCRVEVIPSQNYLLKMRLFFPNRGQCQCRQYWLAQLQAKIENMAQKILLL